MEKFLREKWDKLPSNEYKETYLQFLFSDSGAGLGCLKTRLPQNKKEGLIRTINQLIF